MIKRIAATLTALCFTLGTIARCAYADPMMVGIGNITNTFDSTSESFSLARYLRQHQTAESLDHLRYVLVDHPADAAITVSGTISGTYRIDYQEPNLAIYFALGIPLMFPGFIYLGTYKNTKLEYSHSVDLNFWRNGRKVDSLRRPYGEGATSVPPEALAGEQWLRGVSPEMRDRTLDPIWAIVSERLRVLAQQGPNQ